MTYAVSFLRQGNTTDIECSRSTARLQLAKRLIETEFGMTVEMASDDTINAAYTLADTLIRERVAYQSSHPRALATQGERHATCGRMVAFGELHWLDTCKG